MPWKEHSVSDWERKVHELQMKLLRTNAELKLKTLYAARLEILLHQRHERIDQLFARLEQAHTANRRLEAECEHLAHLIATSPADQTHINGGLEASVLGRVLINA